MHSGIKVVFRFCSFWLEMHSNTRIRIKDYSDESSDPVFSGRPYHICFHGENNKKKYQYYQYLQRTKEVLMPYEDITTTGTACPVAQSDQDLSYLLT